MKSIFKSAPHFAVCLMSLFLLNSLALGNAEIHGLGEALNPSVAPGPLRNPEDGPDRDLNYRVFELERTVRDLQMRLYDIENLLKNPPPAPPPVAAGPECMIRGVGAYGNYNYSFRVAIDGQIVSATDNFDQALANVAKFRASNLCTERSTSGRCVLLGQGAAGNYNYSQRIGIKNIKTETVEVIFGTDNQDQALLGLKKLKDANLCL